MPPIKRCRPLTTSFGALVLCWLLASAAHAQGQPPGFSKSFNPDLVGPSSPSTLTFTIDNTGGALAATDLAFTDNFPAGVVLTARAPANTCGGTLTAVSGSATVSLTGGSVPAGGSCTILVEVTSATQGMYANISGDLTSSAGNSGPARDTLTVAVPPTFSKSFSPGLILIGGVSTLTLTIDNSASALAATGLDFIDPLPPLLVEVASPPNASTTCTGGTLTAVAATETISYTGGSVAAGASCTVSVDVTSSTNPLATDVTGTHTNTAGPLTSSLGNSGNASADLVIADSVPPPTAPAFSKEFSPDAILTGGTSSLVLTIDNTANVSDATSVDFTDNLPAGVVLTTRAPAVTCVGGTLTAVPGTAVVSYTGGTVPALSSCVVNVEVTSSTTGTHVNTTGALTSSFGDSGTATDTLGVGAAPAFSKTFSPATIATNAVSTLTFLIDNSAGGIPIGSLVLTDNLPAGVVVASPANASTTCSLGVLTATPGSSTIDYTGGTIAAGSTCTVTVDVTAISEGTFANIATLSSAAGRSPDAGDTLTAAAAVPFLGPWGLAALAMLLLVLAAGRLARANGTRQGSSHTHAG